MFYKLVKLQSIAAQRRRLLNDIKMNRSNPVINEQLITAARIALDGAHHSPEEATAEEETEVLPVHTATRVRVLPQGAAPPPTEAEVVFPMDTTVTPLATSIHMPTQESALPASSNGRGHLSIEQLQSTDIRNETCIGVPLAGDDKEPPTACVAASLGTQLDCMSGAGSRPQTQIDDGRRELALEMGRVERNEMDRKSSVSSGVKEIRIKVDDGGGEMNSEMERESHPGCSSIASAIDSLSPDTTPLQILSCTSTTS